MNDSALERCSRAAFETRYQASDDPWRFATSSYERGRYEAILESLTRKTYAMAFEPGCSVGELTRRLARRCDKVLATDIAPSAAMRAKDHCADLDNVEIVCADVKDGVPQRPFDLVVCSEIGYYFPPAILHRIATEMAHSLVPGGELVAVHWLGESRDHVLHGDAVHEILRQSLTLRWVKGDRHSGFLIDTWLLDA